MFHERADSPEPSSPTQYLEEAFRIRRRLARWDSTIRVEVHEINRSDYDAGLTFGLTLWGKETLSFNIYHYEGGHQNFRSSAECSFFALKGDHTTKGLQIEWLYNAVEEMTEDPKKYFPEEWTDDEIVTFLRDVIENSLEGMPCLFTLPQD